MTYIDEMGEFVLSQQLGHNRMGPEEIVVASELFRSLNSAQVVRELVMEIPHSRTQTIGPSDKRMRVANRANRTVEQGIVNAERVQRTRLESFHLKTSNLSGATLT